MCIKTPPKMSVVALAAGTTKPPPYVGVDVVVRDDEALLPSPRKNVELQLVVAIVFKYIPPVIEVFAEVSLP